MTKEHLKRYFNRIGGIEQPTAPSLALLQELIYKHATHIAFDALSIHFGETPDISSIEPIFNKLVTSKRGGWCYEMNGLFFYVLKELGFEPKFQLASVYEGEWLPPSHVLMTVQINDTCYLVDVGFGNLGLSQPIEIVSDKTTGVMPNGLHYQLTREEARQYLYSVGFDDNVRAQYRFSLDKDSKLDLCDFAELNDDVATAENSPFTNAAVIKIVTPDGFLKLINHQLTTYLNEDGKLVKQAVEEIQDKQEYMEALRSKFYIKTDFVKDPVSPLQGKAPCLNFNNEQ